MTTMQIILIAAWLSFIVSTIPPVMKTSIRQLKYMAWGVSVFALIGEYFGPF